MSAALTEMPTEIKAQRRLARQLCAEAAPHCGLNDTGFGPGRYHVWLFDGAKIAKGQTKRELFAEIMKHLMNGKPIYDNSN